MKKTVKIGILMILLAFVVTACVTKNTILRIEAGSETGFLKTDAPLPPAPVAVIQPNPAIERQLAAFSGAWFGRWDNQMDHILIIEQIESPEKIIGVYSFGSGFEFSPGWFRVVGKFAKNELQFRLRQGTVVTYQMRGNTLKAT